MQFLIVKILTKLILLKNGMIYQCYYTIVSVEVYLN